MGELLGAGTRVHVIGVGGAGMSGLALVLHERGCVVSGSDRVPSEVTNGLAARGLTIYSGHDASHIGDADVVTYSPAVASDNPERRAAVSRGIVELDRAQALAALTINVDVVGLCGTHGKTTATSMMIHVLSAAGLNPSWLVGAPVEPLGPNGHWHDGSPLVLEVDESFGTFSLLAPSTLGVLNIEADHLDYYQSLAQLDDAFAGLMQRTTGDVVVWSDDPGVQRVVARLDRDVVRVGRGDDSTYRVGDEVSQRDQSSFSLVTSSIEERYQLAVPGAHNVANAAVVATLARRSGVPTRDVAAGLAAFRGAPRRFQYKGRWHDADVVDDYAHLPGEITATLQASRDLGYRRIAVVFQPHRVTRSVLLAPSFAHAFDAATSLIVTDIYTSGESNPEGVTGEIVLDAVRSGGAVFDTVYAETLDGALRLLDERSTDADLVLVLGAGDVGWIADQLVRP